MNTATQVNCMHLIYACMDGVYSILRKYSGGIHVCCGILEHWISVHCCITAK